MIGMGRTMWKTEAGCATFRWFLLFFHIGTVVQSVVYVTSGCQQCFFLRRFLFCFVSRPHSAYIFLPLFSILCLRNCRVATVRPDDSRSAGGTRL